MNTHATISKRCNQPLRDLVDRKGDYFIQIKADVINDLIQNRGHVRRALNVVDAERVSDYSPSSSVSQ